MLMTIPQAKALLEGATYYGPFEEPDTKLYEKDNKWYRVKVPCLACLGIKKYDDTSPIVQVTEVELEEY